MNEWMKWQAPITLFSRPPRPRVVSNRKLVGSPGARVLVVIPPPYQFCQVFSVYPSCTHQTDYGAIARVKRSSLSEKSTAVRQQRMGERERLPPGHRLLSPRFLCLLPHRENKLRRRAAAQPTPPSSGRRPYKVRIPGRSWSISFFQIPFDSERKKGRH